MAKVILICGKICSGKTVYAKRLIEEGNAVLMSSDELISALFHPNENKYHDQVIGSIHEYLIKKSVEIVKSGTSVILDWGFWTKQIRTDISDFYKSNGIEFEWHYIDIDGEAWYRNIEQRNNAVIRNDTTDYYVDNGLIQKLENLFEVPTKEEIDVWCKTI